MIYGMTLFPQQHRLSSAGTGTGRSGCVAAATHTHTRDWKMSVSVPRNGARAEWRRRLTPPPRRRRRHHTEHCLHWWLSPSVHGACAQTCTTCTCTHSRPHTFGRTNIIIYPLNGKAEEPVLKSWIQSAIACVYE